MTLDRMLSATAERTPEKVAVMFGDRRITYRELDATVARMSAALSGLGVKAGDKVGILSRNSPEFVVTLFAAFRLGVVVVPVNFLLKPEEIHFIAQDSEVVLMLTQPAFLKTVSEARQGLALLRHIVATGGIRPEGSDHAFETLLSNELRTTSRVTPDVLSVVGADLQVGPPRESAAQPSDTAVILYTAGTTGKPKGAMLSHKNFLANVESCRGAIELRQDDVFLDILPMFHSFALTTCVFLPFSLGATVVVIESLQPPKPWLAAMAKHKVTIFPAVPPVYAALAKIHGLKGFIVRKWFFRTVRFCVSGAAALPVEVLKVFEQQFGKPLLEGYGPTEASPVVSLNPLHGIRKAGSVGLPIPGVRVTMVGDDGREVPTGEVGELCVQGENVMQGYYHLPEQTAEVIREGRLFTGDMARFDEDGYIYIVDRKRDILKVKGLMVYPKEIENHLVEHPAVAEAAVVGVADATGNEVVVAFVVLNEGATAEKTELIKYLRDRLAPYKMPKLIEFKTELPKNALQKVTKPVLRDEARALLAKR